jgi:hypothetical protein
MSTLRWTDDTVSIRVHVHAFPIHLPRDRRLEMMNSIKAKKTVPPGKVQDVSDKSKAFISKDLPAQPPTAWKFPLAVRIWPAMGVPTRAPMDI